VAGAVAYIFGFGTLKLLDGYWWKLPLYFLGWLWVVALGEEVFFRGFLLHRLRKSLGGRGALAASSLIFGMAHLWFREFPNWKHVAMATTLGLFCGWAYLEAKAIRAAVVTHALVVATWRAFIA
jgi:membrane protease YdiL (CAAX protease family)